MEILRVKIPLWGVTYLGRAVPERVGEFHNATTGGGQRSRWGGGASSGAGKRLPLSKRKIRRLCCRNA